MTLQELSVSSAQLGGGASPSIAPAAAALQVRIALPLQSFVAATVRTPLSSFASLIASLAGLVGFLGVFRLLFKGLELSQPGLQHQAEKMARRVALLRHPSLRFGVTLRASGDGGKVGVAEGGAAAVEAAGAGGGEGGAHSGGGAHGGGAHGGAPSARAEAKDKEGASAALPGLALGGAAVFAVASMEIH